MKVRDKVKILRKDCPCHGMNGHITSIDGELIMVRPYYQRYSIELYRYEISPVSFISNADNQ